MPELRKDPVVGRWVIIATERARRPGTFLDQEQNIFDSTVECPFCDNTDYEIYSLKADHGQGWKVRVVLNGTPILSTNEKFARSGKGLYDEINGYGANEVVIETPEHVANLADLDIGQITLVLETYEARFRDLEKDHKLQYILAYKNYGWAAGSRRIGHARSQIIATSVNPLLVKEKLAGAKHYFEYRDRCIYCDMIQQEIKVRERIIIETDHFVAMAPFASRFPFEILILPKKHHCDFAEGINGQEGDLAYILKDVLLRVKNGLGDPAYNYLIQTAPFRRKHQDNKWRTIEEDYHWHIELVPRLARVAGFEKGSGFYICSIPPEETAEFLREVRV